MDVTKAGMDAFTTSTKYFEDIFSVTAYVGMDASIAFSNYPICILHNCPNLEEMFTSMPGTLVIEFI